MITFPFALTNYHFGNLMPISRARATSRLEGLSPVMTRRRCEGEHPSLRAASLTPQRLIRDCFLIIMALV